MRSTIGKLVIAGLCAALAGCGGDEPEAAPPAGGATPTPAPAPPPPPELRLEVDAAAKTVTAFRNDQPVRSWGVAVGTSEWPTQNGEWTIGQVVWNPGWTPPPDEEWAKEEEPKDPGDPENPLGTVQMVYDAPRTIHGTNEPESIGTAASHGSIRMRNAEAEELARMVMEAGGARRDESFFAEVKANRTRRYEVAIPNPIPIRVINGARNADAVEGERDGGAQPSTPAPAPSPPQRTTPARRSQSSAAPAPRPDTPAQRAPDTAGHSHHAAGDST
jgi:hypothetical protein